MKKGIAILLGVVLIITGMVLASSTLVDVLGSFLKGYNRQWTQTEMSKVVAGVVFLITGFIALFAGLTKKAAFWLVLLGVFLFIMGVGSYFSYQQVMDNHNERSVEVVSTQDIKNGIEIEIPLNSSTTKIADILKEKGMIKNTSIFKLLSKINGYDGSYRAGTHIVSMDMNYDRIMRALSSEPESIKVTIPEGLTYKQTIDILVKKKLVNKDKFDTVANNTKFDYKFLEGMNPRDNKLEGYLFPDTYNFEMKAGENHIIKTLLENFNKKFKPEYYKLAADKKLTIDKAITLASIIEREARDSNDRRIIAGIFLKRLNSKDASMSKLQSCATIQYIFLNKYGTVKQTILTKDTEIDDPYNTYKYKGLPPGPICSPGEDSIDAVLNPKTTDYWYFVARGDGTTEFTKTYKDHVNAMKKYGLLK